MPPKRKAPSPAISKKKRIKRQDRWDLDDPEVYEVQAIVDERKSEYLILWAPDRITGQTYDTPDWIPKSEVNLPAIEDWEKKKKLKQLDKVTGHSPEQKKSKGRIKRGSNTKIAASASATSRRINSGQGERLSAFSTPAYRSSPGEVLRSSPLPVSRDSLSGFAGPRRSAGPLASSQASTPEHSPSGFKKRKVRVEISPLRLSQRAQYVENSHVNFDSSQVITGTAPEQGRDSPSQQKSTESVYIDAAGAPDLSQRHSEYENGDTSRSTVDTAGTAEGTTPLPPRSSSTSAEQNKSIVIPDSQSGLGSLVYVPPGQSVSQTTNGSSRPDNDIGGAAEDGDEISDWSVQSNRGRRRAAHTSAPATSAAQLEIVPVSAQGQRSLIKDGSCSTQGKGLTGQSQPNHLLVYISSGTTGLSPSEQLSNSDSSAVAPRVIQRSDTPPLHSAGKPSSTRDGLDKSAIPKSPSQTSLPRDSVDTSDFSRRISKPLSASTPTSPSRTLRANLKLASPFRAYTQVSQETPSDQARSKGTSSGPIFETQLSPNRSTPRSGKPAQTKTSDLFSILHKARDRQTIHPGRKVNQSPILDTSRSFPAQIPSQWPDTFNSAPPRPKTLSPSTPTRAMSSASPQSFTSETSLRIQELRDAGGPITPAQRSLGMTTRSSANRPGSPAILRDARSPSAVPSAELVPMPTEEENRTSERYLTLIPDKPEDAELTRKTLPHGIVDDSSVDGQTDTEIQTKDVEAEEAGPGGELEVPSEYAVPIFFLGQQRDHYKQSIVWQKGFLEEFILEVWPEGSPMMIKAEELVERLRQVTSHPDLMNEESFTQDQMNPKDKAQWDRGCSAKFRFIGSLLSELAQQSLHIVIDIEAGRLFDIMDIFLTGLGIKHSKAGSEDSYDTTDMLRVTLLSKHLPATGLAKADLVLGFEGSMELIEDQRKDLRSHHDNRTAPLLYLVVPKTVEHIERQLFAERYASLSPSRRLTMLVENAVLQRAEAGHRREHDQDLKNSATSIAKFIVDGHKPNEWPIDDLPAVAIRDSFSDSQATTESEVSALSLTKASKRPLDDDMNGSADLKKPRIDETLSPDIPSTIDPSSLSLSAVTNSVDQQLVDASEYLSDLASLRHEHETREMALQRRIMDLETRLEEHVSALESLQYRYEEQRMELVKTRTERDGAYQSATLAAAQMSSRDTLVSKIKAEREEYKRLLDETRVAFESHAVPEVAAFEALRAQTAEAEKAKAKVEVKVESLTKDVEYTRGLYQDASSRAVQIAEERNELESRVADLEKRASDSVTTALRLANDKTHKQLNSEIKRLQLTLADREKVLQQREEEMIKMREKERGRMGTRGASVPRSPGKLGSPMRLEPPRSSGVGSRAASPRRGSPAAGALGAPVKSRLGR